MNRFQQRRVGRTDLQVSVLGLGGAPLGDLYERIPPDRALATLETAYWRGIRLFDTAPLYGHGLSEHRFGHVLREKPRAEFVISTKVGRWLRPERSEQVDRGQFVGGLNFQTVYDYSYDGTMRAAPFRSGGWDGAPCPARQGEPKRGIPGHTLAARLWHCQPQVRR